MKRSKKKLEKSVEFSERLLFLDVYTEFDRWLSSLGFRTANTKEGMSLLNYHYTHYDKHIDSLYSVERYLHDDLKLSIHFLRGRYEHKIMFVGEMGTYSETKTIDQAKETISIEMRELINEELTKLGNLVYLNNLIKSNNNE
ncbi:MAG: hypothetical protein ACOVNU_04090 [Candidatus Kapaibacteriota bacterium]